MSARRLTVRLSAQARVDFEDILVYTERQWDDTQAEAYGDALRSALHTLSEYPGLGRPREELSPDLRSYPVGQHIVYYRVRGNSLFVRRIVHSRREIEDIDSL